VWTNTDTFAVSGFTGLTALKAGRRFVGFERKEGCYKTPVGGFQIRCKACLIVVYKQGSNLQEPVMLFTRLGTIAAFLVLVFGCLQLAIGLGVASEFIVEPTPGRYLGSRTSGQMIDRGVHVILFSIVLGILTEISRSLRVSAGER